MRPRNNEQFYLNISMVYTQKILFFKYKFLHISIMISIRRRPPKPKNFDQLLAGNSKFISNGNSQPKSNNNGRKNGNGNGRKNQHKSPSNGQRKNNNGNKRNNRPSNNKR